VIRKLFLVPVFFLLGLFLFSKPAFAQTCVCAIGSITNPTPNITSNSCPANSVATCSVSGGSIYNMQAHCNCVVSDPGVNCAIAGQPQLGQTCCVGYYLGPYNQCIPNGVNPYQPPVPLATNSPRGNVDLKCPGDSTGINTAIGCIHVIGDKNAGLNDILKWAIGVGSGVAFLLMLYAGFMVMTASGNPERLKAGQELLTSAIAGLILLIFSVFILKFIGVDLLCLCKFGFGTTCPASCLQ